ncbi:hypothetical protein [Bifidobacterium sp. SO4]|uniref:hypothetical protein n=1 Tax=Bifidobacterium sp. SO4 TaxID=2809030 RepID=UPI001BDC4341|nr:hypothetical protein [Bifidobacterium sp. SO4]MBT1171011.1 hypothetical protein [Bifidobacterium sp. SO4]
MPLLSLDNLGWDDEDLELWDEDEGLPDRYMPDKGDILWLLDQSLRRRRKTMERLLNDRAPLPTPDRPLTRRELDEIHRKNMIWSMVSFYPEAKRLADKGQWKKFANRVVSAYALMLVVFDREYHNMPDEMKPAFALDCYSYHGDGMLAVREAVKQLPKQGPACLPAPYSGQEELTVYRAGAEAIELAADSFSWTWDRKVAEWFLREYQSRHARYLYQARIKTADVIGCILDRNESEVVQFRSVYDLQLIDTLG